MAGLAERLRAYWRLSRAEHGLMTGVAVVAGAVSAGDVDVGRLVVGVVTAFLVEVFLFVTNDILNIEEDRVNSPDRPLVRGDVGVGEAWVFAALSLAIALALSASLGAAAFLMILFAAAMGFLYNWRLKHEGIIGNVVVALLTSFAFMYGGVGVSGRLEEKIVLFTAIAFTANLGREIAKGVRDVRGDAAAGVDTVAVLYGAKPASMVSAVFMVAAVLMSMVGFRYVGNAAVYGVLIGVTDALFLYSAALLVLRPEPSAADRVRRLTLVGMATAILAFMA